MNIILKEDAWMSDKKKPVVKDHYRRHRILFELIRPVGYLLAKWKLGYTYDKLPKMQEPYILLSNHVSNWDPILVGLSTRSQVYFVASEHISRWKVFPLLKFIFDPIIRYKGTVGVQTVKEILKKVKEKKSVAFFPEGVRTFDGVTMPIVASTAKVVKRSGLALVTYKLHGGYFASPNWVEKGLRKGYFHGTPVKVYSSEEIKQMSTDEIAQIINEDLYEDAYAFQKEHSYVYKGERLAEHMENILFTCPKCHKIHTMRSENDRFYCKDCGYETRYDVYGMLTSSCDIPDKERFTTVRDWAKWQREQVKAKIEENEEIKATGNLIAIENGGEKLLEQGDIRFVDGKLCIGSHVFEAKAIPEIEIHGQHELVFGCEGVYYELHVDPPYAANTFLWFIDSFNQRTDQK